MSDDDVTAATDRLLAGFDFARAAAVAEDAHRAEVERLLRGFLDVVDSLDALLAWSGSLEESEAATTRVRTIERIRDQALRVLESGGVTPIVSTGSPVDLTCSEVVEVRGTPGVPEDTVVEEVVRGYRWRDRLLRRARVAISREEHGQGGQS